MKKPLPPIPLVPAPETPEAKAMRLGIRGAGEADGRRHRLGGEPDWIQQPYVPRCTCHKPMSFYAQLDSINDDYMLADCGMIYVFVCWGCFETKSFVQSY